MDKSLNGLLRSRKFWLAVFGVFTAVIFHFYPEFPIEIWTAVEVLVVVLIFAIAIEDAGKKLGGGD